MPAHHSEQYNAASSDSFNNSSVIALEEAGETSLISFGCYQGGREEPPKWDSAQWTLLCMNPLSGYCDTERCRRHYHSPCTFGVSTKTSEDPQRRLSRENKLFIPTPELRRWNEFYILAFKTFLEVNISSWRDPRGNNSVGCHTFLKAAPLLIS